MTCLANMGVVGRRRDRQLAERLDHSGAVAFDLSHDLPNLRWRIEFLLPVCPLTLRFVVDYNRNVYTSLCVKRIGSHNGSRFIDPELSNVI